jgi:hypothetical protein
MNQATIARIVAHHKVLIAPRVSVCTIATI